ncbi:Protein argonaute 2 [Striga hermonthica]|uniref:Protein argonaute 2 n=1 Tax=Striga hermonthica TaxID=68872 RepID=A0A9N7N102_STRHE|nr:Protein argonaute 2 [Striga hermonthica]
MEGGGNNFGRGRGRGRGGEGRGQHQGQGGRGRGNYRIQPNQGGGRGRGDAPPPSRGPPGQPPVQANQPPPQHAWISRPPGPRQSGPIPGGPSGGGAGARTGRPWGPSAAPNVTPVQPQHLAKSGPPPAGPSSGGTGSWTGRPWGPSAAPTATPVQPRPQAQPPHLAQATHQPSADAIDLKTLKITEEKPQESQIKVMSRPDRGGKLAVRSINLLVNHFPVKFNSESIIMHYDVDVKPSGDNGSSKKKLRKSEMALIKNKLFSEHDEFSTALLKTVYDAEKNIFSSVRLPTGVFTVEIPEDEEVRRGLYTFTIKLVNELKLSKLKDYLSGNYSSVPRNILQGMDLVMKDNPSRKRIGVGRSFYSHNYRPQDDLKCGVAAHRGFQQSLKPTSLGLALCLDYSVIAFRKKCSVIEFLSENVRGFKGVGDVKRLIGDVNGALIGLKVRVNHRRTKQKYTIAGLTQKDAHDIYFDLIDPEGLRPPTRTALVDYFREKWGKDIVHKNIPCLELGNPRKPNAVPMEFCELVEGQRYPKEDLDRNAAVWLKNLSLPKPGERRTTINDMVRADDGPIGDIVGNFGMEIVPEMSSVRGRIIHPPKLRLGGAEQVGVDAEKCQWNLLGKSLVQGKPIDRWALIDFTEGDKYNWLDVGPFVDTLIKRFHQLKIKMKEPLVYRYTRMQEFSSVQRLENLLNNVVQESARVDKEKLQLIVCVMSKRDDGYKLLKWVSETKLGVITQCCLSSTVNNEKGWDQTYANLCLKINAKLGGNNFELLKEPSNSRSDEHIMFIGADVNHPAASNSLCPSIAAVVGTVNWPAANRYAARMGPQAHRCEKIENFGAMCLDLVKAYARANNNVRPKRIVLFRDGVSEGQFEMVLGQEFLDLKLAICDESYNPRITVVVAQKRHQTRLFVQNERDGGRTGNVPPGTVVDTDIVSPRDFDFYLCSHYGGIGTSKPTHYYVLWDENGFTSDGLQKLIYDMCFTFARCTKPVSLVPPVYYADLVAYRGRMFQEVLLGTRSYGLGSSRASSSSSGSPPSSGDASFNQSFYDLHESLKDVMFFV